MPACVLFISLTVSFLNFSLSAQDSKSAFELPEAETDKDSARRERRRSYRYILASDLSFLLGFNGSGFLQAARQHINSLSPGYQDGDSLRYGFSATLQVGISWLFEQRIPENRHKWALGFQLRNMFSVGTTSLVYFQKKNSPDNFYSQQDLRVFYAFQPALAISVMLSPLWELQFYAGPSLNINFYRLFAKELVMAGFILDKNSKGEMQDSDAMNLFSLGAFAGVSLSRYFYPFFSLGISTGFVLNISPHWGPNAGKYNLGQLVFGLSFQFSL